MELQNANLFVDQAPTAEENSVGKPQEVDSHIPWWDKIGVNTALNFKESQNWHHPVMTDEEIESLVERMPNELELAGLSPTERDAYLRARYTTLQSEIARARSTRKRSSSTFEPVTHASRWDPVFELETIAEVPSDSKYSILRHHTAKEQVELLESADAEQEILPPQPYGPRTSPPPLPEVSFWTRRKTMADAGAAATALKAKAIAKEKTLEQKEANLERDAPWLSSSESTRVRAEKELRNDPASREKIADSIRRARALRLERWETLTALNEAHIAQVQAQGGHERLAWHQFTDDEWKTMSDVEFAYWRHEIATEWMKANPTALKDHDPKHAGTITIALRKGLEDWQRALYEYERALSPAQLSTEDTAVWHYELRKSAWYKAGQALEARLIDVERRSVLHRRNRVLNYLCQSFNDWANYYETALENASILEKWGTNLVNKREFTGTEDEIYRQREQLRFRWSSTISLLLQELQRQKQAGPFPFDTPLEKIDQHVIDKIYSHIVLEEEQQRLRKHAQFFSADLDLPPTPLDLKAITANHPTMLVSSGDSAESGLFGTKLVEERIKETKRGITGTVKEMDRRSSLMHMYWRDHNIKDVEFQGKTYTVPETDNSGNAVPYEAVEHHYFLLLDDGLDVHGLYEKPQWQVDEAGRFRISSIAPLTTPTVPPISAELLEASGPSAALNLLNDLVQLAFPLQNPQKEDGEQADIEYDTASAEWSHLGFLEPIKYRSKKLLQVVMSRGHPTIVKAEREAAFYSTESEVVDPHPHLWQRLLNINWRMHRPPLWLISKLPDMLGHWRGVSEQDLDVPLAINESTGALSDPRKVSLENPQRKAWELSRMRKEYTSILTGATLTDRITEQRNRLLNSVAEFRPVFQHITSIESSSTTLLDTTTPLDTATTDTNTTPSTSASPPEKPPHDQQHERFLQLRRDLITTDEINAAKWASEFDFKSFCRDSSHLPLAMLARSADIELLGARFNDGYLATVKEYVQPALQAKLLESVLLSVLRLKAEPQEVLDLETNLFHRRQRIQLAFSRGLPLASASLMMYYYHAYALRSKVELLSKSTPVKTSLATWASRYLTPSEPFSPFPRSLAAAVYQIVALPYHLLRYAATGALPFTNPSSLSSGSGVSDLNLTPAQQAQKLVELTQHIDQMSDAQPWKMWTSEPWTWRSTLADDTSKAVDAAKYSASMNPPRAEFWKQQERLWGSYVDSILGFAHQLAIEQRISQGIPSDKGILIDGSAAHKTFEKGQKLLTKGKSKEALVTFTLAARQGSSEALYVLGKLHSADVYARISEGLPASERLVQPELEKKSRAYLSGAIAQGHRLALSYMIHQCISPPKGAEPDLQLAIVSLRTAIEEYDLEDAKLPLATLYERSGFTSDLRTAIKLYREVGTPESKERAHHVELILNSRTAAQNHVIKDRF